MSWCETFFPSCYSVCNAHLYRYINVSILTSDQWSALSTSQEALTPPSVGITFIGAQHWAEVYLKHEHGAPRSRLWTTQTSSSLPVTSVVLEVWCDLTSPPTRSRGRDARQWSPNSFYDQKGLRGELWEQISLTGEEFILNNHRRLRRLSKPSRGKAHRIQVSSQNQRGRSCKGRDPQAERTARGETSPSELNTTRVIGEKKNTVSFRFDSKL